MRIVTRRDFDGLVCSVLVTEAEDVSRIRFAHPKVIQDRMIEITSEDILLNLPYHPDCGMWFDHHVSEREHGAREDQFKGRFGLAPSCARLIYEYYSLPGWKEKYADLIDATDRIDSAQLTLSDILMPQGWLRLANTVDPRTGFESSEKYFLDLIEWIKQYPLEKIFELDEVRGRLREFFKEHKQFEEALKKHSWQEGAVIVTDFRPLDPAPVGSRFLVYALYPTANVSVRVFNAADQPVVTIAVGRSIINRTCEVDIGNLMSEYGGGGHVGAGTCRVSPGEADDTLNDIVMRLNAFG
ncbi:MAG: exopolyphosphatase [Candidatus Nitrospinota bacterium M3_3B_026]